MLGTPATEAYSAIAKFSYYFCLFITLIVRSLTLTNYIHNWPLIQVMHSHSLHLQKIFKSSLIKKKKNASKYINEKCTLKTKKI